MNLESRQYEPYVSLCRSLSLARHFEYGDFYEIRHEDGVGRIFVQALRPELSDRTSRADTWPRITWLPMLSDWAEKFETELHVHRLTWWRHDDSTFTAKVWYRPGEESPWDAVWDEAITREEAVAKLWVTLVSNRATNNAEPVTADKAG